MVVVAIAVVAATLAGFLQFTASLLGLPAVLAMSADGFLEVRLRLVDAAFTLVVAVHSLTWHAAR